MRRTLVKKLALLLSLVALAALGLVACGGGDDEDSATEAKASAHTTTTATACPDYTDYIQGKLSSELACKNVRAQVQELKAKLPPEQMQELKLEGNIEAKLSTEQVQALRLEANEWARDFSRGGVCDKYMGQPICVRLSGSGPGAGVHATRVSAAFQKSFADATVEDIKSVRIELVRWTDSPLHVAAVKFSNGEVVVFDGATEGFTCAGPGSGCTWSLADDDHNRRFLAAAARE
jgi:hypothetical protein